MQRKIENLVRRLKRGWWLCLVIFAEWVDLMAYEPSKYHSNYFWSELTEAWVCFTFDAFDTENDVENNI